MSTTGAVASLSAMTEGWFFMTAALLVLSGGTKLRDPAPTRGALRTAGLPSSGWVVSALAATEIVAGATGLLVPHPAPAVGVAVLYAGFAGFVGVALATGMPLQSCGCFGRSDTPPGVTHLVVDLLGATAAVAIAIGGGVDLLAILAAQPGFGIPYLGFVAIGTVAIGLLITDLPSVLRRPAP